MSRLLLINAAEPEETRAALVEDGRLVEYRAERSAAAQLLGNVYKGRVVNFEPAIGAAFVDIGVGRNAFLHVSDCPGVTPGREARVEDLLAVGQELPVQVTREAIGPKGPVLTANVSLPGRYLVLLPFSAGGGVSRRIDERNDRDQLRGLVRELERRAGMGLIVRTAGAHAGKRELLRDLRTLRQLWASIQARAEGSAAPALLHQESGLVWRALRDLVDETVTEIVVDTPEVQTHAEEAVQAVRPGRAPRVRLHAGSRPLFHAFDVEAQVDRVYARRVPLEGGGSLVFDRTEAMVTVDVNSGRTRTEEGLEATALATNLEAAGEIARQIRLRDLGGVIAIDFIDMREPAHVREVERCFRQALGGDRARVRASRMGPFGVYVLTRRHAGTGVDAARRTCPRCGGAGELVAAEQVALRAFRELLAQAAGRGRRGLVVRLHPEAAEALERTRKGALAALRAETGRDVRIEADPALAPEAWEVGRAAAP